MESLCILARVAGGSIKPGVERSETPGSLVQQGRDHDVGDSHLSKVNCGVSAIARFARSVFLFVVNLGFRCAPPQALCFHPLRGF